MIRDRYKEKVKNDVKESLQDSLLTMLTAMLVQNFQSPKAASTQTGPQESKTAILPKECTAKNKFIQRPKNTGLTK